MKLVIPGGSGQVGTLLARAFQRDGHDVVVFSRTPASTPWRTVAWDGATPGDWQKEIDGADVVVNLAGRSVNCRYSPANRAAIMESRTRSTRVIGQSIAQSRRPPRIWLQASTATIYAHRYDAPNNDLTGILGGNEPDVPDTWRFSIEVATAWERALDEAVVPATRTVKMRSAMIMNVDAGGIFDTLLGLVRRGLGGTAGAGRQYISWIHPDDFIASLYWIMERPELSGAVNIAAPNPLPNREFMRALREAGGVRVGLPAASWMLEVGAFLMRTETELILKSRRVVPARLLQSGFSFRFPSWPGAASHLYNEWRSARD
ncbi:MAG: TIGR01777 family oxidoreductase [Longimicrobiales bacterium]